MMNLLERIRLAAAILTARAAQFASRTLKTGGGSTVPGVVARRVDPDALAKLSARLPRGTVAITGTNGKTTTTRMVGRILESAGIRTMNNSTGANLSSGVTAALVSDASLSGKPASELGLFEVDEASVPEVVAESRPRTLAVLNLFRDQLDRYGELAYTGKVVASAFDSLPPEGSVLLNADDPLVASLGRGFSRSVYFGLEELALDTGVLQHVADSKNCPVCGAELSYRAIYFGHMGLYDCPNGDFNRPEPQYLAKNVRLDGPRGADFTLVTPSGEHEFRVNLPGLYNVYNALGAAAVALEIGVEPEYVVEGVRAFSGAFGRVERVQAADKEVFLLLIKNPVGFNEILRTFMTGEEARNILISINDNHADGRDISWLWDVDFEMLAGTQASFMTSGIRAEDMAVRLKYAEIPVESTVPDRRKALQRALEATPSGGTLYVLPTYTAMLEIRRTLSELGYTHPFWED